MRTFLENISTNKAFSNRLQKHKQFVNYFNHTGGRQAKGFHIILQKVHQNHNEHNSQ